MAYIGNPPAERFTSFDYQDLTGGTGTSFTLTHPVGNAQEILVMVNNVVQEPGVAYTVSGTGLTMTGSIAAADDFYVVYRGKAIQTATHPSDRALTATDGTFTGDLTVDTNTLHVDATNNNVGIGLSSPLTNYKIHVDANSGSDGRVARFSQAGTDNAIVDVTAQNGTNTEAFSRYRNDANFFSVGIDSNDNFSIGKSFANTIGNTRVTVLSGGGITFNGDTAAANALDDYEEGTWTPTSGVGSAQSNSGHYTKIGREVTVYGDCTFSGGGGANIEINGLPFTVASPSPQTAGCVGFNTIQTDLSLICIPSTTSMNLYNGGSAGVNIASGKRIIFTAVYVI